MYTDVLWSICWSIAVLTTLNVAQIVSLQGTLSPLKQPQKAASSRMVITHEQNFPHWNEVEYSLLPLTTALPSRKVLLSSSLMASGAALSWPLGDVPRNTNKHQQEVSEYLPCR